jgi:hypothetical protein
MTIRAKKPTKAEAMLVNLAESIGSGLGTPAGKAVAAKKALAESNITSRLEREGKKFVHQSKKLIGATTPKKAKRAAARRQPNHQTKWRSGGTRSTKLSER